MKRLCALLVVTIATLVVPLAGVAHAYSYTVNITTDSTDRNPGDGSCKDANGKCSLRAAIMEANAHNTNSSVILASKTYTLTIGGIDEDSAKKGDLDIRKALNIKGTGTTIIKAGTGFSDRIFDIPVGVNTGPGVVFDGVHIQGGKAPGSENGGGIRSTGVTMLRLANATVFNNSAPGGSGGGLSMSGGSGTTLSVPLASTFDRNSASVQGGGVDLEGSVVATIHGFEVTDNTAPTGAGMSAFISAGATGSISSLVASTFSGNAASGGTGGALAIANTWMNNNTITNNSGSNGAGIAVYAGTTGSSVIDSRITSNDATSKGGGLYLKSCQAGCVTVSDLTVEGNSAADGSGIYLTDGGTFTHILISANQATGSGSGGAVYHSGGASYPLVMTNVTLANNTGGSASSGFVDNSSATDVLTNVTIGGGTSSGADAIAVLGGAAAPKLRNTLLQSGSGGANCSGSISSQGHNLDSGNSCGFNKSGDITNQDPDLVTLGDYGGGTYTLRLDWQSPAIDAGDNSACPADDQRSALRPQDGGQNGSFICDIGAYESTLSTANTSVAEVVSASPTTVSVGQNVTYTFTFGNAGPYALPHGVFTDILPSSLSFVSCRTTGGGSCSGSGNNQSVTFSSIGIGSSPTVTIVAKVLAGAPNKLTNTACIYGDYPDLYSPDNVASATVTVN